MQTAARQQQAMGLAYMRLIKQLAMSTFEHRQGQQGGTLARIVRRDLRALQLLKCNGAVVETGCHSDTHAHAHGHGDPEESYTGLTETNCSK
eukprot:scaffold184348_cov22-Tisochrysis_lutea.AAC.1